GTGPASYIRTQQALADAVAAFRRAPLVAVDTEAASFHRYRDRIFLIQLSTPSTTVIVDPLAVPDLSPVGELLADPGVEKLFHDADYDLRIFDRDYGFRAKRMFDTRVAAQLAGEPAVGLAALLAKYVGVKLAKALPPRQLAALRELYRWRETLAAKQDTATFRIIGNDALLAVAKALPRAPADLATIRALPSTLARRHGSSLLESVRRARGLGEAELPRVARPPRAPRDPGLDERVERLKAARNRVAAELGLDPGVLCGRPTLEAVARAVTSPNDRAGLAQIGELRRWQIQVLGDALLAALG